MRSLLVLLFDLLLIAVATLLAVVLRDNFEIDEARLVGFVPYLFLTVAVATGVLPLSRITRSVWHLAVLPDYLRILAATIAIVIGAVALGFVVNRLDGVARAVPIIQGVLILCTLVGARIVLRVWHGVRAQQRTQSAIAVVTSGRETVLVVGFNRLTQLYLQSVAELAPDRMRIAGLLSDDDRHSDRVLHGHPILGTVEQVANVLRELEVRGMFVDRIVVTVTFKKLSPQAQDSLLDIEKTTTIRLDFLDEIMGLDLNSKTASKASASQAEFKTASDPLSFNNPNLAVLERRAYWWIKRTFDIIISCVLLVTLAPVMLLVGIFVMIDVGLPVTFWQQRPGRRGRPFKLHKFRTMGAAHNAHGQRIPDEARLSAVGHFLRNTHLDELPQLLNVLVGEMSFVGPRPLLPIDQPTNCVVRFLVRPGITGWAQINGGRDISAEDKGMLDVWYVQNATATLDFHILLRTAVTVIFKERTKLAIDPGVTRSLLQPKISRPT